VSEAVYLTVEEVAKKLKLKPQTIYRSTEIPRIKVGGSVRFIESQVDQYFAMKTEKKSEPKRSRKQKQPLYDLNARITSKG
jgi:excisionase family DNA binding protein